MAIDHNVASLRRDLVPAGTWGNVTRKVASYEMAAQAQNEVAAVARYPANCVITGVRYLNDALGATTGIQIGYEAEDGSPSDPDAFATVADSSTAGNGDPVFTPIEVTEPGYITVKQTGAGTATGTVTVVLDYIYTNK